MTKTSLKVFKICFFVLCLAFVCWQTHKAFERFVLKPRSTSVGVDHSKNWRMPKVVICPAIKTEILGKCNLDQ